MAGDAWVGGAQLVVDLANLFRRLGTAQVNFEQALVLPSLGGRPTLPLRIESRRRRGCHLVLAQGIAEQAGQFL